MNKTKAALYIRTSTKNQTDSIKQQRNNLQKYCEFKDYAIFDEYVDFATSGKSSDRPQFQRLMDDAYNNRFDIVLVTKIDRFARSLKDCLESIYTLEEYGIKFTAIEQPVDTSDHYGRLSLQIMGAFSEFERNIIAERMEQGRKDAEKRGIKCSRPKSDIPYNQVVDLVNKGLSANAMAKFFDVSRVTMVRRLEEYGYKYNHENRCWV